MSDRFQCGVIYNTVTMFNDDKYITITIHNKSRDGSGSINISLTSPWMNDDPQSDKSFSLDSVESFEAFYNALMEYNIPNQWVKKE